MKKLLVLLTAFWAFQLNAQHETLFSNINNVGAFGGPLVEISSINGQVGADVGGGGALILNSFFIGGYGMGTNFPEATLNIDGQELKYEIDSGHGGLWFGYTPNTRKIIHPYGSLKIGWGKTELKGPDDTPDFSERTFVMIPEAGVEVNVTDFFRIAVTGGYRWVNGINDLQGLENEDFSSALGAITFRFGGFISRNNDWDWDWD